MARESYFRSARKEKYYDPGTKAAWTSGQCADKAVADGAIGFGEHNVRDRLPKRVRRRESPLGFRNYHDPTGCIAVAAGRTRKGEISWKDTKEVLHLPTLYRVPEDNASDERLRLGAVYVDASSDWCIGARRGNKSTASIYWHAESWNGKWGTEASKKDPGDGANTQNEGGAERPAGASGSYTPPTCTRNFRRCSGKTVYISVSRNHYLLSWPFHLSPFSLNYLVVCHFSAYALHAFTLFHCVSGFYQAFSHFGLQFTTSAPL